MSLHIFAVGKIDKTSRDIVLTPMMPFALAGRVDMTLDAREMGRLDARDGLECDPLRWFSDLERIESYIIGFREAG